MCETGDTCNSGNCVDGVCCDLRSCAGPCRACNLPGAAGSWTYRLQYRDRRGRDYLLATIRLTLERVESTRGVLTTAADAQPVAVQTVAVLAVPEAGPAWLAAGKTVAAGPEEKAKTVAAGISPDG